MREEKIEELEKIIDSLKTIKKEKLTKEPRFIRSEVYRCHLNNDKTITREKILKNNKDGSADKAFKQSRQRCLFFFYI